MTVNQSINQTDPSTGQRTEQTTTIIFALAILFLIVAIVLVVVHRPLNLDPVWVLLCVPFTLAMTGALILFYFLSSSASISREAYKVGGAIAGFMVLFTTFYNLSSGPYLQENTVIRISESPFGSKISPIFDRYNDILAFNNETINKMADASLQSLRATFEQLSHGTYTIDANELPTYLLPMIEGAKNSFYATQYVYPERFWGQNWASKYFEENIAAIKQRHVKLRRIFIIDPSDGPSQQELLHDLIKKHFDGGIPMGIIERPEYVKTHTDEDLHDILIVDGQLSGLLLLNRGGSFNKVEFSIDKDTIERRQRMFDRLLASSVSYEEWAAKTKNMQLK